MFRSIQELFDDENQDENIDLFDPQLSCTVRDIHLDADRLVKGNITDNNKVVYMMEVIAGLNQSHIDGVLYGPDVLHGYEVCGENTKIPIMMCIADIESAIVWFCNGTNVSLRIATISIVRPKITGSGVYKCVVNGQIVACLTVTPDYEIKLMKSSRMSQMYIQTEIENAAEVKASSKRSSKLQESQAPRSEENSDNTETQKVSYTDIKESQLVIGEYIAEGGGGIVHKGVFLDREVAIKKIAMPSGKCRKQIAEHIKSELNIHSILHCDSIVQLLGKCELDKHTLIVTEYVNGPDLDSFIFDNKWLSKYHGLQEEDLAKMAFDMTSSVAYMHESQKTPIIHRDLKPGNFVLKIQDLSVKLIDLGISKHRSAQTMGKTKLAAEVAGTWSYCAPEKMLLNVDGNVQVDIWGLGACLAELFTRKEIWEIPNQDSNVEDIEETDVIRKRMTKRHLPDALDALLKKRRISKQYKDIISDSLSYVPGRRPAARAMTQVFKSQ